MAFKRSGVRLPLAPPLFPEEGWRGFVAALPFRTSIVSTPDFSSFNVRNGSGIDQAQAELKRANEQLRELMPVLQQQLRPRTKVSDQLKRQRQDVVFHLENCPCHRAKRLNISLTL